MGRVEALWVKRAHRGPMDAVERVVLLAGRGVAGSADQGGRRQLTLLSREAWRAACLAAGAPALAPVLRRANVLVAGVELGGRRGAVLRLGSVRVRLFGETRPCERMEEAQPGLRAALAVDTRGGVFGEILDDGELAVGDAVTCAAAELATS